MWGPQNKNFALPTKPPLNSSSKVTFRIESRSYNPEIPESNNAAYEKKKKNEKKNLTASHTQQKASPIGWSEFELFFLILNE